MIGCATNRERKRAETSHQISMRAQELTDERGLDGFTMDELAEAVGVSRRTLFNYYPSKIDAVLGEGPVIPDHVIDTFVNGGPHGHLFADLGIAARTILLTLDHDREQIARGRRLLRDNPRLLAASEERFLSLSEELAEILAGRKESGLAGPQAALLIRMIVAVFESAGERFIADDSDATLLDHFDQALVDAHRIFS